MDASQARAVALSSLAGALVIVAGIAAISPAAWASFPGLNGQLAYQATSGARSSVFTIQPFLEPLDGEKQLTLDDATSTQAAWSADGRRIAFVTDRDGNPEIYVMNADGTDQTRLTTDPASDSYPTWSPGPSDSARIAFTSTRDGDAEIYVMDADGTDQTRLTFSAGVDQRPDWHPQRRANCVRKLSRRQLRALRHGRRRRATDPAHVPSPRRTRRPPGNPMARPWPSRRVRPARLTSSRSERTDRGSAGIAAGAIG